MMSETEIPTDETAIRPSETAIPDDKTAIPEAEISEVRAEEAKPVQPSPMARKAALVDAVTAARRAHSAATDRLYTLRADSSAALLEQAKAHQAWKEAEEALKKETEGGK